MAFDSDGGGGGGSGGESYSREDLERQAERAVDEGKSIEKIANLLEDNHKLRQQRRQAEAKLPSEDEIVLSAGQAEQLRELGVLTEDGDVSTSEVEEKLSEGQAAQEKLQARRRKEHRQQVAEAAGVNPGALEMATKALDAEPDYEIQGEGENASVVVKTKDGAKDFSAFADKHFADIKGALYQEPDEDDAGDDAESDPGPPTPRSPSTQAGEGNRPSGSGGGESRDRDQKSYRFESGNDVEW
jgi:hypothetical protein